MTAEVVILRRSFTRSVEKRQLAVKPVHLMKSVEKKLQAVESVDLAEIGRSTD